MSDDRDRDAALAGAVLLGLIGTAALTIGVGVLAGWGWATVAFGASCIGYSLLVSLKQGGRAKPAPPRPPGLRQSTLSGLS